MNGASPLEQLAGTIFVGREPAMRELCGALAHAATGQPRLVLLVGEPGIGKTRTAEELAGYAHERKAKVLWGRCHEGEGAPAYWPWVQIVRAYMGDCETRLWKIAMGSGAANIEDLPSPVRRPLPLV
jgi:predicted ATPase